MDEMYCSEKSLGNSETNTHILDMVVFHYQHSSYPKSGGKELNWQITSSSYLNEFLFWVALTFYKQFFELDETFSSIWDNFVKKGCFFSSWHFSILFMTKFVKWTQLCSENTNHLCM